MLSIHACRGSTFWLFNRSLEAMPRSAVIAGVAAAAALAAGAAFVVAPARAPSPPTACQPELALQVFHIKKLTYTPELAPCTYLRAKASGIWSQWICGAGWQLGPGRRRPTDPLEESVNQKTCDQRWSCRPDPGRACGPCCSLAHAICHRSPSRGRSRALSRSCVIQRHALLFWLNLLSMSGQEVHGVAC